MSGQQHALADDYTTPVPVCQRGPEAAETSFPPGTSNTQVEITPEEKSIEKGLALSDGLILDWLSGTFLSSVDQVEAFEFIDILFGPMTPIEGGWAGYEHQAVVMGCGLVRWSDLRPELGVHVSLSAEALANVKDMGGIAENETVRTWLADLVSLGFRPSRVDFAVDEREGLVDLEEVRAAVQEGRLSTRFREIKAMEKLTGSPGNTIYFGSSSSSTLCRMYDKGAEQGVAGHWVRVEFQFRRKNAASVIEKVVKEGESGILGLFRSYIDFKVEDPGDSNVTRQATAPWWLQFLRSAEKCGLGLPAVKRTIEEIRGWFRRSIAPSLALLVEADGGCVDWLYEVIREGRRRIPPHRWALLESVAMAGP